MNDEADPTPESTRPKKPKTPAPAAAQSAPASLDERLDEALAESFPASDPPAVHRTSRD